jgi:hypothetical protein
MQPPSAPISDLLFLPYLFHLKFDHPSLYFREQETQNQRHEVCLKYIGSKSGASGEPSPRFKWDGWEPRPWSNGVLEYWSNGEAN